MAQLAVVSLPGKTVKEITSLLAAATANDKFQNDGKTFLLIRGGTAPTGLVTVASEPCSHGRSNEDLTQSPAADTEYLMGPFPPGQYNDANGDVNIATTTSITDIDFLPVKF
jgi:hypothetical protein